MTSLEKENLIVEITKQINNYEHEIFEIQNKIDLLYIELDKLEEGENLLVRKMKNISKIYMIGWKNWRNQ